MGRLKNVRWKFKTIPIERKVLKEKIIKDGYKFVDEIQYSTWDDEDSASLGYKKFDGRWGERCKYKTPHHCAKCGNTDTRVLQEHHLYPDRKKLIVLCANCHVLEHMRLRELGYGHALSKGQLENIRKYAKKGEPFIKEYEKVRNNTKSQRKKRINTKT